jgi:hypothetical protein
MNSYSSNPETNKRHINEGVLEVAYIEICCLLQGGLKKVMGVIC